MSDDIGVDRERGRTLLRSQLRCLKCQDVIASLHVHDFNSCHCGAVAIDGGRDYFRVVGGPITEWEPCSIYVDEILTKPQAGFTLAVLKACGFAFMQELGWVSTRQVVEAYEGMKRPYMPAFYPTDLTKSVRFALKMLHRSGVVSMFDPRQDEPLRGYLWKPCAPFADRGL